MQFVPVRQFRVDPASVWAALEKDERLVVTNHGRPTALMIKVDGDSLMETIATVDQARWTRLLARIRAQVVAAGADKMTEEEIEAEIAAARAEMAARAAAEARS
jgi:PHD/YefM family antitoxin component YafN of YafNO toxin-antitoxin module